MKQETIDALVGVLDSLVTRSVALGLRVRGFEQILAQRDKTLYQEYIKFVNTPGNSESFKEMRKSFRTLRQVLLQDRE